MTWLDPNNKEVEALCGIPYRKEYISLGRVDDTTDEHQYRAVYREGDVVRIKGHMDLMPSDVAVFSRAVASAADEAIAWFKAETRWQQLQMHKLSQDAKLTYRMIRAEFIFDGIHDGNGNLKDYRVALYGNRGRYSACVSADEESRVYDLEGIKVDFSKKMAERIMRRYLFETGRMEG